ncbi:cupin domain-containing protein [Streptomyces sp. NBC_01304]|uniref:cupin domain-containing protein n=1 Tax=Streptomyces sp. NBC_01304 TaxID=2903818 RepID=UPI002E12E84C|nr:cupin domain-containing protein [Streptomyces sp. NBC_01304]
MKSTKTMKATKSTMSTKKSRFLAAAALTVAVLGTGIAQASPGNDITAETTAEGHFVTPQSFKVRAADHVVEQTLRIQPGGATGWHVHPGVVVLTVQKGTIIRYSADGNREVFPQGSSFIKTGNLPLNGVNESSEEIELHLTYILPKGAPLRYERPAPSWWNERKAN